MQRKAIPVQLSPQHIDKLRDFLSIDYPFFEDATYNAQFIDLLTQYAQDGSLALFERLRLADLIYKLPKKWQNELDDILITESTHSSLMFHMEQSRRKINKIIVPAPQIQKSAIGLFPPSKSISLTKTAPSAPITPPQTPSLWFFQKIWRSDWLNIKTYKIVKLIR